MKRSIVNILLHGLSLPIYHFPDYLDILHEKGLTRGQIEAYGIDYLLLPTREYDRFVLAASPVRWNPLKVSDGAILLERIQRMPLAGSIP